MGASCLAPCQTVQARSARAYICPGTEAPASCHHPYRTRKGRPPGDVMLTIDLYHRIVSADSGKIERPSMRHPREESHNLYGAMRDKRHADRHDVGHGRQGSFGGEAL